MSPDAQRPFPGTPQYQALLRAIVEHYENDPRILAVAVLLKADDSPPFPAAGFSRAASGSVGTKVTNSFALYSGEWVVLAPFAEQVIIRADCSR